MALESSNGRQRRRYGDKLGDNSPERPRLGGDQHPNLERAGAQPHPAMRVSSSRKDAPHAR